MHRVRGAFSFATAMFFFGVPPLLVSGQYGGRQQHVHAGDRDAGPIRRAWSKGNAPRSFIQEGRMGESSNRPEGVKGIVSSEIPDPARIRPRSAN